MTQKPAFEFKPMSIEEIIGSKKQKGKEQQKEEEQVNIKEEGKDA